MKREYLAGLIVLLFTCALQAQVSTTFNYSQTNATTGSGTIAGFVIHDSGGDITFGPTAMPSALVVNPGTGTFVGRQTAAAGGSNEANVAPGLAWSGSVTATGTRGAQIYTVQIPLKFVPKVTQSPDVSDYNWNVIFGDDAAGGTDVVTTANMRVAMWYSRDTVDDTPDADTANTFQRYTQLTHAFTAGQNTFTNNELVTTNANGVIPKDATDSGDPQGTDAAGRDLAFYFGWRDQAVFAAGSPQVLLVDDFSVGGLLNPDLSTLNPPVPEPGMLGLAGLAVIGFMRRRRA